MENMLPLNFGVRTKGRIKANTLLNPAFRETFSVKYFLRKEIVHHHMDCTASEYIFSFTP